MTLIQIYFCAAIYDFHHPKGRARQAHDDLEMTTKIRPLGGQIEKDKNFYGKTKNFCCNPTPRSTTKGIQFILKYWHN